MAHPTESVLVVDDSPSQRAHIVALCRAAGIPRIQEAGDGEAALDFIASRAQPPDLMVLDLEMPKLDGIELLEQLRARGLAIPVILLSAREAEVLQCTEGLATEMGVRVVAAIHKPLDARDMERALRALADTTVRPARRRELVPDAWTPQDLAQAIDAGRIGVLYQPKVGVGNGALRGAEALARWAHPQLGTIGPDRFIAVAERHGFIHKLTLAVLEQAAAQVAEWNRCNLRISVAVNLSPLVLGDPGIVDQICAVAERHGVKPSQLVLEVTESAVVSSQGSAAAALVRLRLKGFGLSIDDFGTGFSSIQQLARVPFTELKVDRSFVHGAAHRNTIRVILTSALEMSRQLSLNAVAEGIETEEDWRLLQDLGCASGQGYFIGRPMEATALPAWMHAHRARIPTLWAPDLVPGRP